MLNGIDECSAVAEGKGGEGRGEGEELEHSLTPLGLPATPEDALGKDWTCGSPL